MREVESVPFVVGRIAPGGRKVIEMQTSAPAPIPGPWELRAVVAGTPQPVGPRLV